MNAALAFLIGILVAIGVFLLFVAVLGIAFYGVGILLKVLLQ